MTRVKVCGITSEGDAEDCATAGANAIGFVFAESPRRVTPGRAREILRACEPFVVGVGVFLDSPAEEVRRTLEETGCGVAQLHGEEPPDYIEALAPFPVVKAVRVKGELEASSVERYAGAAALLLDTYVEGVPGGTGQRFDLALAAGLRETGWRVILAGGLTPENVGEAIAAVRPYAVDVSSGVEAAPGRKDAGKVARFMAAVRAADREVS
jgi:phosphoribosylanthranilate isomerase